MAEAQARLDETRALLDDLRGQMPFADESEEESEDSIDDVPLSALQQRQLTTTLLAPAPPEDPTDDVPLSTILQQRRVTFATDPVVHEYEQQTGTLDMDAFNDTKGKVLSEINLTARELEIEAPMDEINDDLDHINTAAELMEYRAGIVRLLYANRAMNDFERAFGTITDADKESFVKHYEKIEPEHDVLRQELERDRNYSYHAAVEEAARLSGAAAEKAMQRLNANAGPKQVRPGDIEPRVVDKEISYIINEMPGHQRLTDAQKAEIKTNIEAAANSGHVAFWPEVEKAQNFVTSLQMTSADRRQATSLVAPPAPAPKQRAPAKPAAKPTPNPTAPKKVVEPPGFKTAPPAPAAAAAPAAAPVAAAPKPTKEAGEPSKTQLKKAQAIANKWWRAHPRGKTRDMNTASKKVVTMARDYKPGKNDFKGLDDGSRGYRVKW